MKLSKRLSLFRAHLALSLGRRWPRATSFPVESSLFAGKIGRIPSFLPKSQTQLDPPPSSSPSPPSPTHSPDLHQNSTNSTIPFSFPSFRRSPPAPCVTKTLLVQPNLTQTQKRNPPINKPTKQPTKQLKPYNALIQLPRRWNSYFIDVIFSSWSFLPPFPSSSSSPEPPLILSTPFTNSSNNNNGQSRQPNND